MKQYDFSLDIPFAEQSGETLEDELARQLEQAAQAPRSETAMPPVIAVALFGGFALAVALALSGCVS